MGVFLCSYLVNDRTGSPFLVQLVGGAFFAPMFFGGVVAGVISDRFDRRRTILLLLAALVPVAAGMGVLVATGTVQIWMVYPFMLAVGLGGVLDMTSRRALIYDVVGEARLTNALALEGVSMSAGTMLGSLMGGAVITFVGMGQAFLLIAVAYSLSFLCLLAVPSPPKLGATPAGRASLVRDLAEGVSYVRRHRALVSLLGVTVLMNVFYFSYLPMVPVFADRLGVNALLAGLLASGGGIGMLTGSLAMARFPPQRRGLVYVGGSLAAMVLLFVFAAVPWYVPALAALVVAGVGQSGFGTMQSVLVMTAAGAEMRGRAMGLLGMAIGGLPFGMVLLGAVAQGVGAPAAVMLSVTLGFGVLALWLLRHPEAARLE